MQERERQRAIAGLDVYVDVLSSWRGRYEDDDEPATIAWIVEVIPQVQDSPQRGWLCVRDTATPGIGWTLATEFSVSSLCRSMRGKRWPVSRADFRKAARLSGVDLPARHATIYLNQK